MIKSKSGCLMIVDDEVESLTTLCDLLSGHGYMVASYTSGRDALEALKEQDFDLLLTDLIMPEMDGIELLKAALEIAPNLGCIVITGKGTIQSAVEAMKVGAFDYVLKPVELKELLMTLFRAMGVRRLQIENLQLRETVAIYELSQAIAFTMDLNTILNKVADAAIQQLEADEASIMLPTPEGNELYIVTVRGENRETLLWKRVPIEQGIAGWVARHYEPLTLNGMVTDHRFKPIKPRANIRSAISMPMLVGGKLAGILNVNSTQQRRPFTLGQVKALSILAGTAASALESAHLYSQVREAEEKYRLLVNTANETIVVIQDGMLKFINPKTVELTGYSEEELTSMPFVHFIHPDDKEMVLNNHLKRLGGETIPDVYPFRIVGKDGSTKYMEISTVLITWEGRPATLNFINDVTERKRAEERLQTYQEQLRSLASQLSLVEERERRRIATDLHDHIGQTLALCKIKVGTLRESTPTNLIESLDEIRDLIEQIIQYTRSLTFELSSPILYDLGFEAAVEWLGEQILSRHGIKFEFEDDGKPKPIDDEARILLFQAARELLVNIAKHAKAHKASVCIWRDDDHIRISVEDDGVGFDTSKIESFLKEGRFGIFSIRERLRHLGGYFELKSEYNCGTRIDIGIPETCK